MKDSREMQETDAAVERKVRRRVAKTVLKDLHKQADDINRQVDDEKRANKFVFPILMALAVLAGLMLLWPDILQSLTALINAG